MMTGPYRSRQIIKIAMAAFAAILLSGRLGGVPSLLGDRRRIAMGTAHPAGSAQLTDGFVTLSVVQQVLEVDHRRGNPWVASVRNPFRVTPHRRRDELILTVRNLY